MKSDRPELIAIDHDDFHAKYIGKTKDKFQFFLTTPFEPAIGGYVGCQYIALFKFDLLGNLVESKIDSFGSMASYSEYDQQYLSRLSELGEVEYCRIEVKPFSIKYNNVEIGLIVREPKNKDDVWAVELLPGNYMAFFEPWDSGKYDT